MNTLLAHVTIALLFGGSFTPGSSGTWSPRVGVDADCFLPHHLDLFERGHYHTAGRDGSSRVSLSVPLAGRFSVAPGFVATHAPGQNLIRPSLGLTYTEGPHFLVYTNYLTRDRLGGQGIDTGVEYRIPGSRRQASAAFARDEPRGGDRGRRRWGVKFSGDVLHLWVPAKVGSGADVVDVSAGVYF